MGAGFTCPRALDTLACVASWDSQEGLGAPKSLPGDKHPLLGGLAVTPSEEKQRDEVSREQRESDFFPRLLQHGQSYRRKAMDAHEPPSWIWAPLILPLWPGVKQDTRRCETGTPSLLPSLSV